MVTEVSGGVDHDSRGRVALLGQAEAAIADAPARWTHPLVVQEDLPDVLSVPILETGAAELSANLGRGQGGGNERKNVVIVHTSRYGNVHGKDKLHLNPLGAAPALPDFVDSKFLHHISIVGIA